MGFANGTPSLKIWLIGSKRILGISEERFYFKDYSNVPEELVHQITWESEMFADFIVCPLRKTFPG